MVKFVANFLFLIFFLGCSDRDLTEFAIREKNYYGKIYQIADELDKMGFNIDKSKIKLELKESKELQSMFNDLNNKSQNYLLSSDTNSSIRLAFYDPNSQTIFIRDNESHLLTDGYLAHELMHVYQDQKWGLNHIWAKYMKKPSPELFNITQYLIEGHAELGRTAFEQNNAFSPKNKKRLVAKLTDEINEECALCGSDELLSNLPYEVGLKYFAHLYKRGGWPLVESKFNHMPTTTKEIIFPKEDFFDKNKTIKIPHFHSSKFKVRLIKEEIMGMAYLWERLIGLGIDKKQAFNIASGWEADLAQSYKIPPNEEASLWRIAFTTPEMATKFENGLKNIRIQGQIIRNNNVVDWIFIKNPFLRQAVRKFLKLQS